MQLLHVEHEWTHVDILNNETNTKEFLGMNANAKIPVLEINKSEYISESNAILHYFADGSDYLPSSRLERTKVLQWQFFEQYSHEPNIAVARYINTYLGLPVERLDEYKSKQKGGHKALLVMESQLSQYDFLVGSRPSIADISLFAYTHVAHEGGFDLKRYPHINAWIKSIKALPNYIEMKR